MIGRTSGKQLVNGVDVQELGKTAETLKGSPDLSQFRFHVTNHWIDCGRNRTTVKGFYGTGQEIEHKKTFKLDADEPPMLMGKDAGANPVEFLLHSLTSCITSSLVYHAAIRGITVEQVESSVEGDLDVRGFMGLSDEVRKGLQSIRATFRVKSDGSLEDLEQCARFSPVLDVVGRGTNVDLRFEKI